MRTDRVSFRAGPSVDMPLIVVAVVIVTLGLVNLYSATSVYVDSAQRARLADVYVSQIYWVVVGGLLAIVVAAIDYRHFERLANFLYLGGLLSLGFVFILGSDIRGSSRWIEIGRFAFQPSEFMKIVLILMLARFLHNDTRTEPRTIGHLLPAIGIVAVPWAAVMAQPDLGTSVIYLLIAVSMLSMNKVRRGSLLAMAGTVAAAVPLAWKYVLRDYQKARVTSFLDPEADKTGTGWHALQSQTAIGNGQLFGEGFMQGTQNQFGFLPDQYSDFPFAVFAEDWGFVGGVCLIALYAFLSIWAIHIASESKDRFGAAVAIGVGSMIFWHSVLNIGMAVGLLPVVGITLPLFSYGGSSIVTTLIGIGLLMNVSMRR
ncbi:MAG: rod shape-determining protein RodA [Pseudomonadota bacterium]|nr:MAG: rod shape-determining protein RodA [Pseudomonadota bacterium]